MQTLRTAPICAVAIALAVACASVRLLASQLRVDT